MPVAKEILPITLVEKMATPRKIAKVFKAVEKSEGAGARVRRSVGTAQLRNFSPFLMLDHFTIGEGAGFPDHPHRGQETITYLLSGSVDHEDFAGNAGTIHAGDLQFMTAGRGILHAEMPGVPTKNNPPAPNIGLQLWVDLPTSLKFCEPRYRDLRASEIPIATADEGKVTVKVISGNAFGVDSVRDLAYTPVWILDVFVKPGGRVEQKVPVGWNVFLYVLEGEVVVYPGKGKGDEGDLEGDGEGVKVEQFCNAVFDVDGDGVIVSVEGNAEKEARFVLIAGQPLDQKVVQYGPFVLNTQEQVYEAMRDYQSHSNGFERAKGWKSEIGKRMG